MSEFASKFNLTEKQAYRYISFHKGLNFIEENYGIIHTLDFNEAVDSVAIFCRKSGGIIINFVGKSRKEAHNPELYYRLEKL